MAIYPRTLGSNVHKKASQIYFFMTENQPRESRVVCRKAPLFLWMGMEPQLHGPSTFSYQGKGAAFGQINPLLRSLLNSGLFSYETIYPLINIAKSLGLQNPRFQDKYLYFGGEMDHRKTKTNHINNFKIYVFFVLILKYM